VRTSCQAKGRSVQNEVDALKRQANGQDLTSPNNSAKSRSDDEVGETMGISGDTVRNYISLTQLKPELMEMVDSGKSL
jgi:ParB family chromosome partitioning protein